MLRQALVHYGAGLLLLITALGASSAALAQGMPDCTAGVSASTPLTEITGVPTGLQQANVWVQYVPSPNGQGQHCFAVFPAFQLTDATVMYDGEPSPRPLFGPDGRINPPLLARPHARISLTVNDLLMDDVTSNVMLSALARYANPVTNVDLSTSAPFVPAMRDDPSPRASLMARDPANPSTLNPIGGNEFKRGPAEQQFQWDLDPVSSANGISIPNPLYELLFGKENPTTGGLDLGTQAWADALQLQVRTRYDADTSANQVFDYPLELKTWLFNVADDGADWTSQSFDFERSLRGIIGSAYEQFASITGRPFGPFRRATIRLPLQQFPLLDPYLVSGSAASPPSWESYTAPSTDQSGLTTAYHQLTQTIQSTLPGWEFNEDQGGSGDYLYQFTAQPPASVPGLPIGGPTVQVLLNDWGDGTYNVFVSVTAPTPA